MLLDDWSWTLYTLDHALSLKMVVNSYFIHKAVPDLNKWVANDFDEDVELLHHAYDVLQDSCVQPEWFRLSIINIIFLC